MSGETAQLQRLTDEQVNERLVAYNRDGSLDRDMNLFKDHMLDFVVAEITAQFGSARGARYGAIYAGKADAVFIQSIAEYGRQIYCDKISVPEYVAERGEIAERVFADLKGQFPGDCDQLTACFAAYYRLDIIETDIILAQVALLEAIDAADQRGRESSEFERRVGE